MVSFPLRFLWGFVVAVAFWPGISGAAFTPRWAAVAIGSAILVRYDDVYLRRVPALLLLAWLSLAGLSIMETADPGSGVLDLYFLIVLAGAFLAGAQFDDLRHVLGGLSVGVGVSSALVILQLAGYPLVAHTNGPPSGLFFNSEVLAELAAPLLVWMLVRRSPLSVFLIVPVLACQSRVAIAACAFGLLIAFPRKWLILATGACLVIAITVFGAGRLTSGLFRAQGWAIAFDLITPFGHGLGTMRAMTPFGELAHSDVLQALVELGAVAVPFLLLAVVLLWRGSDDLAGRAAFGAICLEAVVSFPLHTPAGGFLAALLAGHLARVRPGLLWFGYDRGAAPGSGIWTSRNFIRDTRGPICRGSVPVRSPVSDV